jgi:hypothetical protein
MRLGVGLFLITLGAILTFAVRDSLSGVNLSAFGIILMLVGAVVVALWWYWHSRSTAGRRTQVIEREVPAERVIEREVPRGVTVEREVEREVPGERSGPPPPKGPIPPQGPVA